MLACNSINIALELVSVAVLTVLLSNCLLRRRQGAARPLFAATVATLLVAVLGDLFSWVFTSVDQGLALAATLVGNAVCYFFGAASYTLFALLVVREVTDSDFARTFAGRVMRAIVVGFGFANATLLVVNFPTGILYSIDAQNVFTWGPWRMVPDNILLVQLLLALATVFLERTRSIADTCSGLALLCGVPVMAVVAENFFPTLMLLYPSLAITLLPVHIWNQHTMQMTMAEQAKELAENRALALAEQIKPHFIANTLLAIQQLVSEDPALARKTIQQFSLYLRDNYEAMEGTGLASLQSEIEHVKRYLTIEQADPSSNIDVEWHIGADDFDLPVLSLQPIVENAVRHGIGPKPDGGTVTVTTREEASAWVVEVADDGVGMPADAKEGTGLSNVRERLELLLEGTLEVSSNKNGTCVTARIPKRANQELGGGTW